MSDSPKRPKIVIRGAFKVTDKPAQYNFALHQDKKSYQPRYSTAVPVTPQVSDGLTTDTRFTRLAYRYFTAASSDLLASDLEDHLLLRHVH